MPKKSFCVLLLTGALSSGATLVQAAPQTEPQAAPANQPAAGEANAQIKQIASFVGNETIAVTHIDLAKLEPQKAEAWLADLIKTAETNPQRQEDALQKLRAETQRMQQWVSNIRKAGAEDLYIVMNSRPAGQQADQQPGQPPVPPAVAVVVPVGQDDDVQAIKNQLRPQPAQNEMDMPGRADVAEIRNAVVLAPRNVLDDLKQPQEGSAQDLAQALNTVSGTGIQIAFAPTGQQKQTAQNMLQAAAQSLPQQVNPEDVKKIPQSVQWTAIGINTPPDASLKLIVQADNPEAAKNIANTIGRLLESVKQNPDVANRVANVDRLVNTLTPTVNQNQVTLSLNREQVNQLVKEDLVTAWQKSREGQPIRAGEIPPDQPSDNPAPDQPQ